MEHSSILPFRGRTGALRLPVLALGLLPLFALPAAARVQDPAPASATPVVALDRLRFEFKCYFGIQEWKGKGEEFFLKKLSEQKVAYKAKASPDLGALEGLMAQALWARKETYEKDGDADKADEMAALIGLLESKTDPVVMDYQDRASAFVVKRNYQKAKDLEKAGKLDEARKSFKVLIGAKDPAIGQEAVSSLVRIVETQQNFQAVLASNDLTEIGTMLDAVVAELRGDLSTGYEAFLKGTGGRKVNDDLKKVEDERTRNAGSTQNISVSFRDVAAALAEVKSPMVDTSHATFRLEPESGADAKVFPPVENSAVFKKIPFKWYRGTYTVRAYASKDDKAPFAVLRGVALLDAPAAVEIPNRAPAGMVWVPPLKAGGDALFIDRYEVTVGQVRAVAGSGEGDPLAECARESASMDQGVGDNHPAWFFSDKALLAYEAATGKKVPTDAQWVHAAFGGFDSQSHPFPWGKQEPDSTRAFVGETGRKFPDTVGGRPAGAAPCGAEDMAGNLAEWVRKGTEFWLLGGNYSMTPASLGVLDGRIPLRDPMPGKAAYEAMSGTVQGGFLKYKFNEDDSGYLVGLRTVVPVPASR